MTSVDAPPAATVALIRDRDGALETLLLLRSRSLGFHGGEWVFPGGRVDPEDACGEALDAESTARRAGVRESFEEAGLTIEPSSLVTIAHWTTPTILPRRFATYFFLARAPDADVRVDGGEIESHRWMRPADAIEARDAGKLALPPPTFVTLAELASFRSGDDALEAYRARPVPFIMPRLSLTEGFPINLFPGDAGYQTADATRAGPRHRLLMEKSCWRYER